MGLAAPHQEFDRIVDQMRCAHRYRNTLVEIERGRRAAERAMVTAHSARPRRTDGGPRSWPERDVAAGRPGDPPRARADPQAQRVERREGLVCDSLRRSRARASAPCGKPARESPRLPGRTGRARSDFRTRPLSRARRSRYLGPRALVDPTSGLGRTYQLVEESAQAVRFASVPSTSPTA